MEASALTHASRRGLLARRSPLLKLQGDEKLIAMARGGNPGAFEAIVDRYQGRLLGFCRQMLGSTEDAEDVLQEVFVNAYRAMLADEREINLRPWLYRIARNRCLNYLRKPKADAQESMDMVPEVDAASTAERVHNREEFRQILSDVNKLPETQRAALLLREMDALSYEEIAAAMETTVPSVKSLLVRARISLAEASQARLLTCGEVHVELSEAAEGLRKVSAPVRRHVRECEECADFRSQVRSNEKALAALFPVGPLIAFKGFIASKLGLSGAGGASAGAAGAGAGAGAVGGGVAAIGGGSAASGLGALGGAIGTKAAAGVVTAALLTAGAVEVKQTTNPTPVTPAANTATATSGYTPVEPVPAIHKGAVAPAVATPVEEAEPVENTPLPAPTAEPELKAEAPVEEPAAEPTPTATEDEEAAGQSVAEDEVTIGEAKSGAIGTAKPSEEVPGAHGGSGVVVVTTAPGTPPAGEPAPAPESTPPPAESPPAEEPAPAPPVEVPPVTEAP
ncbi:MAG TPA: sigma-70 family RNA polymerase sigma factor [Solirubrobacterales bacterium]|nr:sigma-70 family RNA polymerase sigma factor [Solirubrobacterales bacterium]